jgi:hypothetical protein
MNGEKIVNSINYKIQQSNVKRIDEINYIMITKRITESYERQRLLNKDLYNKIIRHKFTNGTKSLKRKTDTD